MIKSLKSIEARSVSKEEALTCIRSYLLEQKDLAIRKILDQDQFDTPAWSEFQAYHLGMAKALDKLINFIPDQGKNV